jgi:AraC-like DNA-binding protein
LTPGIDALLSGKMRGTIFVSFVTAMNQASLKYLGVFFLIAAAQGLFFCFTQLSARSKWNEPRLFLSLIIFFFSVSLIESGLWWSEKMIGFVHMIDISAPLPFLYGPLVYFYFKSSFSRPCFRKKDLLHFIPFLVYFVYSAQFYFNSTQAKTAMMNDEIPFRAFFLIYVSSLYALILKAFSLCAYGFYIRKEFYSKASGLKEIRTWFWLSLGVFVFYTLNFVIFHVLSAYKLIGGCADYGIATSIAIFIYLFSWFGFVRPRIFDGYSVNEAMKPGASSKYKSSTLTPSLENEMRVRLEDLMRTEKLYKNETVGLDVLAARLGISRNSVSQVINASGMNFFEYINYWRIEEAKKILAGNSKKDFNIIEVAYEVGFNNKVSFNKFFKKSTGLTPTEYRKLSGNPG